FLHGWGIDQSVWNEQASFFSKRYAVITPDLPGFGQSGTNRKEYSIEQYGKDIAALIKQLDVKNAILIGHSMSGSIMLETVINFPDLIVGIIGVDNFKDAGHLYSKEEQAEINDFLIMLRSDYTSTATAYAEGYLFHSSTDSTIRSKIVSEINSSNPSAAISSLQYAFVYADKEKEQLTKLQLPLYLINSDVVATDERALQQLCGNSYRLFTIPATGHYPMLENPELFNRLLQDIIHLTGRPHFSPK